MWMEAQWDFEPVPEPVPAKRLVGNDNVARGTVSNQIWGGMRVYYKEVCNTCMAGAVFKGLVVRRGLKLCLEGGGIGMRVTDKAGWLAKALDAVATAAGAFESRWTMAALRRVDPDLHQRFMDQEADYQHMLLVGEPGEVGEQSAAMVRGYCAITQRMTQAGEPDDAYLLGIDPVTGFRVAIGDQRHAAARVRELHDEQVVFMTPDEVASIIAGLEAIKRAKSIFPDCEVIRLRPSEAAKGDTWPETETAE